MILPKTEPIQSEAMLFFESVSTKHLSEHHSGQAWSETLMYFAQTVPAVRHAATALALSQRSSMGRDAASRAQRWRPFYGRLPDPTALLHYNKAISLLLHEQGGGDPEKTTMALLVCYLFICFEQLIGNDVEANRHLRGGVELARNMGRPLLRGARHAGLTSVAGEITRQMHRLDVQAATSIITWMPADLGYQNVSPLPPYQDRFRSLDEASDHLQVLIARVMTLHFWRGEREGMWNSPPSQGSAFVTGIKDQLDTWMSVFENTLRRDDRRGPVSPRRPLVPLLRLQHGAIWILLRAHRLGNEMEYDNFLPQFRDCVAYAREVTEARAASAVPSFTPELGVLPVLYIIGVKCRDPNVRREALSILRRRPVQEASWDSLGTARVVERIIEIEEGETSAGCVVQRMDEIPVWRRVESVAWHRGAAGLGLTYTFCTREGVHEEDLAM